MANDAPLELPCPCNCGKDWKNPGQDMKLLRKEIESKIQELKDKLAAEKAAKSGGEKAK